MDGLNIKPKVKGHGTFILRDGWLNKALVELSKPNNEKIFTAENATDVFGIGTNMVPAMRYWMQCFNLVEEKTNKGTFLSELGKLILEHDSYLEDIFTLWIMHSNIARNYEKASLFHDYFNNEMLTSTTKELLSNLFIRKWTEYQLPDNSIKSDVDVLFNTYCRTKENDDPEDKIVSPMSELGLIKCQDSSYVKCQPDLRCVPDEVILYELSVMFEREYKNVAKVQGKRSISIEKVSSGPYSLGCIYNFSKIATNQMLNRLQNLGFITVDRTAGLDVVYDNGISAPIDIIKDYYSQR